MKKNYSMPPLVYRAEVVKDSFNEETNTITVIASTGARVKRGGVFSEVFFQELEISKRAIDMTRFKNGAPILDTHGFTKGFLDGQPGIRDVMGVTESPRIETINGKTNFVVDVRFSEREEFKGLIKDIRSGVLSNVSLGFNILRNKELEERVGEAKIFRATKIEPVELSFVPAGLDPGAVTRGFNYSEKQNCEFELLTEERGHSMEPNNENENPPKGADSQRTNDNVTPIDEAKVRKEAAASAVKDERQRTVDIQLAVRSGKLESKVADDMIKRGISADEARTEILETLAKKDEKENTRSENIAAGDDLAKIGRIKGIGDAIMHRVNSSQNKLTDEAKPYVHRSMLRMVEMCLVANGVNCDAFSPGEMATRGLHSSSDFPEILANVLNKTLRRAYEESPQTFGAFTRRVSVPDFKQISRVQLGDAPTLEKKLENGEYVSGTIAEAAEKYSVDEYGKIVPFGRQLLVNDDLDAFARLPALMGIQARNLESNLIWTDILSNPDMADGFALFSSEHKNIGVAAALAEDPLAESRTLLRRQTGLGGNKLNLTPKWLYVPATLETTADKLTTSITPNTTSDVNMFGPGGKTPLTSVAEPRIDDVSVTRYYVMADMGQIDMYELATLIGEEGPVVDSMIDFDTDGLKFKIRHTVGVKAIDHRGMVLNQGA